MFNKFEFDATNTPGDAELKGENVVLTFEDSSDNLSIKLSSDKALELVDKILDACGEKNTDELQDKIYELEKQVYELEEEKEDVNDRLEYMKQHDCYVGF